MSLGMSLMQKVLINGFGRNFGKFKNLDISTIAGLCDQCGHNYDHDTIFGEFLRKEYGGPGTLLVEPFTDMLIALKKKKLPGAPLAARASLLRAQNYVAKDWKVWSSKLK